MRVSASAAAQRAQQPQLHPARLQLNQHHRAPPTPLTYTTPQGVCTVTSRLLGPSFPVASPAAAAASSEALAVSFPCSPAPMAPLKAEGPALNLWAHLPATAAALSAKLNTSVVAAAAAADDTVTAAALKPSPPLDGPCGVTTLSPVLYFSDRGLPLYFYGYSLSGLTCRRAALPAAAVATADEKKRPAFVAAGISVVPALSGVS